MYHLTAILPSVPRYLDSCNPEPRNFLIDLRLPLSLKLVTQHLLLFESLAQTLCLRLQDIRLNLSRLMW